MKSKSGRGRGFHAVPPDECYVQAIRGVVETETGALWEFIKSADLSTQLNALKQLSHDLGLMGEDGELAAVLDLLTNCYIICPHKNPLKRAVASGRRTASHCRLSKEHQEILKSASNQHAELCRRILTSQLTPLLTSVESADIASLRSRLDTIAALHENFQLGERCILDCWPDVLKFVCCALQALHQDTRQITSAVVQTERMHDCLVAIQVWTKIVQKSSPTWTTELTTELQMHISQGFAVICTVLSEDSYLLDCRSAAGLAIPLTVRAATVAAGSSTVFQILQQFFPQYLSSPPPPDVIVWLLSAVQPPDRLRHLSVMSYLCICNGCLALLDPADLTAEFSEGRMLLTSVLGQEIISAIPRLETTNAKLLASKTLAQWATRACCCLEQESHPSEGLLSAHLHGDAPVASRVIEYAWTHWEDPVDLIRHQARLIFEKLLLCHLLATGEKPEESPYLQTLLRDLLGMGWHLKGKYGPLCSLLDYLPPTLLLQMNPDLPTELLQASSEQTLACYVNELYEKLFSCHLRYLKTSQSCGGDVASVLRMWYSVWVDPILGVLCGHSSQLHKTHIIEIFCLLWPFQGKVTFQFEKSGTQMAEEKEYTLPKLLKCCGESVVYITQKLTTGQTGTDNLGALVTCLKRAKMMGILKTEPSANQDACLWNGVVAMESMKRALCHPDEQVRLDAFGLLCENHKTTEVITALDFTLIRFFLPLNMASQTPAFRQKLVALLKKLFLRIREGTVTLKRKRKEARSSETKNIMENHLFEYKMFLTWLCDLAFSLLHPCCGFPSRTTSLAALSMMVHIIGNGQDAEPDVEFSFCQAMTTIHIETLLECFTDTFETNKQEALGLLQSLPPDRIQISDLSRLAALLQAGLDLASSTRPQDCTTAAYLLRILLSQNLLKTAILSYRSNTSLKEADSGVQQIKDGCQSCDNNIDQSACEKSSASGLQNEILPCERNYLMLDILVEILQSQLNVAKKSLLHAAATRPIYPTLNCIRYILTDTALQKLGGNPAWQELLGKLVTICFEVAEVVTPVVSNSSPEGNVPVESIGACFEIPESDIDEHMLKEASASEATVRLMPEYLVVCAWRSIKEVSLLLGQVTASAPIINPEVKNSQSDGLLSVDQLESIGEFFSTQLLESIHRGAFELAYAGFVKMTEMLWRSKVEAVHALPGQWLAEVMEDIRSNDPGSRLCSTRRSAGLPFFVQALVTMEPTTNGRMQFRQVVAELLQMAQQPERIEGVENTAKVHSLNILRALYRDTRLSDDVFPFIAEGLQVAVLGYASQSWNVRNSSTLLFSALITRIFGVNRTKDEANRKNCLTGRVFFNRFPSLYPFLLAQMEEATNKIGSCGRFHLHPGLYPVLMVMGRLYPSVLEGADTNLSLSAFIPHILSCALSPVYKTRLMAARAVSPIVSKDQLIDVLRTLTGYLTQQPPGGAVSQNLIHGALLQLRELTQDMERLPQTLYCDAMAVLIKSLSAASWIITCDNPCLMTRAALIQLVSPLLTLKVASLQDDLHELLVTLKDKVKNHIEQEMSSETILESIPWLAEYQGIMATILLTSSTRGSHHTEHQLPADCSSEISISKVVGLLKSNMYEVRLQALNFILDILTKDPPNSDTVTDKCSSSQKGWSRDMILGSELIFGVLVAMVMDTEQHMECLTKSLSTLCYFRRSAIFPWFSNNKSWTLKEVLHRLMALQDASRDELRSAAHELSGSAIHEVHSTITEDAELKSLMHDWCQLLPVRCEVQQSETARLTCAKILVKNATILLVDGKQQLGDVVMSNWTVVMRLLQDEEVMVRETMATVLLQLSEYLPEHLRGLLSEDVGVQSELAIDLCLHVMSAIFCDTKVTLSTVSLRSKLLLLTKTWINWIMNDLEPDDQEEKEVRLFDKGEMNTYRNDITFVRLVAKHLSNLLRAPSSGAVSSTVTSSGESGIPDDSGSVTEPDQIPVKSTTNQDRNDFLCLSTEDIARLREDLNAEIHDNGFHTHVESFIKRFPTLSAKTPFINTSQYNAAMTQLYRLCCTRQCVSHILTFGGISQVGDLSLSSGDSSYVPNMLMKTSLN